VSDRHTITTPKPVELPSAKLKLAASLWNSWRTWSPICTARKSSSIRSVKIIAFQERPWSNSCTPT
jgi:hypothetical protein